MEAITRFHIEFLQIEIISKYSNYFAEILFKILAFVK